MATVTKPKRQVKSKRQTNNEKDMERRRRTLYVRDARGVIFHKQDPEEDWTTTEGLVKEIASLIKDAGDDFLPREEYRGDGSPDIGGDLTVWKNNRLVGYIIRCPSSDEAVGVSFDEDEADSQGWLTECGEAACNIAEERFAELGMDLYSEGESMPLDPHGPFPHEDFLRYYRMGLSPHEAGALAAHRAVEMFGPTKESLIDWTEEFMCEVHKLAREHGFKLKRACPLKIDAIQDYRRRWYHPKSAAHLAARDGLIKFTGAKP
jgi:hypothetical protein